MKSHYWKYLCATILIFVVTFMNINVIEVNAEEKIIQVGTDTNYVPFEFLDQESGEYIGFDIDLIDAIAEEVGFEYELKPMDYAGIIPALQTGNLDIAIAGITINPLREETIDFSKPYYDAGTAVMVKGDEKEIKSIDDLSGKVIATKQGTSSYDYVKDMEGVKKVVPFPNIDQAYLELEKGSADAVVFDLPSLLYYINTGADGKVLDDLLEGQTFGIGFTKGSPLKLEVDLALDEIRENGTYDALHEKWFGNEPVEVEQEAFKLDWSYAIEAIPFLLEGVKYTLLIAVVGLLSGLIIGVFVGFGRISKNKLLYGVSTIYVEVLRGTPIMIQALYIYFAIPLLLSIQINPILAGMIAISINAGAYIAEIVRGSVNSIDPGQMEAGRSLGLTKIQTMYRIVWPQAFKRMIPPLGNQFIISLKDTSLLTVIGVAELTRQGTTIVSTNFRAVEIYTMVAIMYLVMTLSISFVLRQVERKMDIK